jgi:hypothetical protein
MGGAAVLDWVTTLSVTSVGLAPSRVVAAGGLQVDRTGWPLHENVICWLKPFIGVSVRT